MPDVTPAPRCDAPTPITDELIKSGPFSGPKEVIELWDRAIETCQQLERALIEARREREEAMALLREAQEYVAMVNGTLMLREASNAETSALLDRIDRLTGGQHET